MGGQGPTTRTPPRVEQRETRNHIRTTCHTCARPVLAYRLPNSSPRRAQICRQHTIAQTLRSSGEVAPPQGSALDIDTRTLRPHRRITPPRGSAQSRHHSHNLRLACPALGPSAPFPAYRLAGVASCPGFTGALFRRTPRRARRPRSGISLGRLRVLPGLSQELGFRRAPRAHDGRVRLLQRIAWLASRLVRTFVRGTGCTRAACHVRATRELLPLLLRPLRGAQKRAACSMSKSV